MKVSDEGKNLIKRMLVVDPNARVTPLQALKDPWFAKFKHMDPKDHEQELDPDILNKLKEFKGVSTLKKIALNILVKMTSDSNDVEGLRAMFQKIDKDQTGYISAIELKEALNEANVKYHETELEQIINEIDYHGANRINYSEFLAATMSIKKILTSDRLYAMFR